MKENNNSPSAIAQRTGISVSMLSAISTGERRPSPKQAEKLAAATDIPREVWMWGTVAEIRAALGLPPVPRRGRPRKSLAASEQERASLAAETSVGDAKPQGAPPGAEKSLAGSTPAVPATLEALISKGRSGFLRPVEAQEKLAEMMRKGGISPRQMAKAIKCGEHANLSLVAAQKWGVRQVTNKLGATWREISASTLRRWLKVYDSGGFAALKAKGRRRRKS